MTSKEAVLELICEAKSVNIDERRVCFLRKIIEKDLERLERLEKAFEILASKEINIIVLKYFIEKGDGVEAYNLYYTTKERLTKEEYELLKEALENDK